MIGPPLQNNEEHFAFYWSSQPSTLGGHAVSLAKAATKLDRHEFGIVRVMLLGQAIELALKVSIAHKLVARGFEYDQLFIRLRRRKYGHNLTHLRKVAAKLGIDVSQMRERVYDHIAYAHQLPHASRYPKPADAFRVPSDSECAEVLRFIEEVALKKRVTG